MASLMLTVAVFGFLWCPTMDRGDLNCDGRVDILDLAILAENWLQEIEMKLPTRIKVVSELNPTLEGFYYKAGDDPVYVSPQDEPGRDYAEMWCTPLVSGGGNVWMLNTFSGVLGTWVRADGPLDEGGVIVEGEDALFGTYYPYTPDVSGVLVVTMERAYLSSGTVTGPGRDKRIRSRARGVFAAIRLSNTEVDESFSFERVVCNVEPRGRVK